MESARQESAPETQRIGFADILGDGFFAGATGASVVALFFLAVDAVKNVPLFTPSLVGSVVLYGAEPSPEVPVSLGVVALFSLVHFGLFVGFGVLVDGILSRMRETPEAPLIALGCFIGLEAGALAAASVFAPGVAEFVGHGYIVAANALAAVGMAVWLGGFARHPDDPAE